MNLLALDVATTTGWCLWQDMGREVQPRVRTGSWDCSKGRDFDERAEILSDHMSHLLRGCRTEGHPVTSSCVEDIMRAPARPQKKLVTDILGTREELVATTNANTIRLASALATTACVMMHQFKVAKPRCGRLVPPATWRKLVIGTARAPRHIPTGKTSQWLKAEVRQEAELLGQKCNFTIRNNDESDAVGIALYLAVQCNSEFARRWVAMRGRRAARAA